MSALQDKTVILVTHQVEFLAETDRILVSSDKFSIVELLPIIIID